MKDQPTGEDLSREPRVAEALGELQQYLSDAAPPLVVTDSMLLLMGLPPALVAAEIRAWTTAQYRRQGAAIPVSDYLFHAMRKIHLLGEFRLLPREDLASFLAALGQLVLEQCPEEDRELLRTSLADLDEGHTVTTPVAGVLHRQRGTERPLAAGEALEPAPVPGEQPASGGSPAFEGRTASRRLGLLVRRLEERLAEFSVPPAADDARIADRLARVLSEAAGEAQSTEEFRSTLGALRGHGIETRLDQVIQLLSRALPAWAPQPASDHGAAVLPSAPAQAIQRLVALEKDPAEVARRFGELVQAGVDLFNQGELGRAAAIFDLAERVVTEQRADATTVAAVRSREVERLDTTRLRTSSEDPSAFSGLRRVLRFFPTLQPPALLDALRTEERRERRRLLLTLLEAHGAEVRELALSQLTDSVETFGDTDPYFQRNLLYLLRRIPRPEGGLVEQEVALLARLSEPGRPLALVKEAVASLGMQRHERAEQTLIQRVREIEHLLAHPASSPHPTADLVSLLDRVVYALSRLGTPAAIRAVVEHGLRSIPVLGDTAGRLAYLAGLDLSADREALGRVLKALSGALPQRIFGLVLPRSASSAVAMMEALAGTPAPEVRAALEDVASRFGGRDVAEVAARVLAGLSHPAPTPSQPPPQMSGDLELLGLPGLLQNLAQSRAWGVLTLRDAAGRQVATVSWQNGLVAEMACGELSGEAAFYQLIERPAAGTFVFVGERNEDAGHARSVSGRDVVPLLLEAMRRYDELQRDSDLVPDGATFRAAGHKPTAAGHEHDTSLVQATWLAAISGASALECEAGAGCDAYRVRRLLAHWVEEGALVLRPGC
ncbi:MAG: DUF4388 domain-containing protein [Thermoanaerobaculaceae bacterium]